MFDAHRIICQTHLIVDRQLLVRANRARRKHTDAALASDHPVLDATVRLAAVIQEARATAVRGGVNHQLIGQRHVVQVPVPALSDG